MAIYQLDDKVPVIPASCYIAPEATIIGSVVLGERVSILPGAVLRGDNDPIVIGDGTLIGIGAVVLNHAVVGKDCLIGAGAVVTEGKAFPDRSMIVGMPAKVLREISEDNVVRLRMSAESYVRRGAQYKTGLKRIG